MEAAPKESKAFDFTNIQAPRGFYESPVCTAGTLRLMEAFKAASNS